MALWGQEILAFAIGIPMNPKSLLPMMLIQCHRLSIHHILLNSREECLHFFATSIYHDNSRTILLR